MQAPGVQRPRQFHRVRRAADVDRRVALRRRRHVVDRREVEEVLDLAAQLRHPIPLHAQQRPAQVADDRLDALGRRRPAATVQRSIRSSRRARLSRARARTRPLAFLQQPLHEPASDEAGRAGDEVGHRAQSLSERGTGRACRNRCRSGSRAGSAASLAAPRIAPRPRAPSANTSGPAWASSASPSASGIPKPSIAARRSASIVRLREAREALGQLERAVEVRARRRRPRSASPSPAPRRASTMRPVRIRSSARPMPTIRGSRCVPPSISGTPQRRSG